jgi:hypothetical protein
MRDKLIVFLFFIVLVACNHSPLDQIREHDIKNGGLYYEQEKLDRLGIRGIIKDKDGNIHFYVEEIKPDTRKKIEQKLLEIFGQKIDFILHDTDEIN